MFKIGNLKVYGVIYKITNKLNGKVYIGQTIKKRGFKDRYNSKGEGIERVYKFHLRNKNKGKVYNEHLVNSIDKYGFHNFDVCEVFDFAFSQKELDIKEMSYISLYKSNLNEYGYNIQRGGINGSVGPMSETTKKKLSKIKLSTPTDNMKPILQFELNGKLIKRWERGANQIKRESDYEDKTIRRCCKNQTFSAYGYIWFYEGEENQELLNFKISNTRVKSVVVLDVYGNLISEYNNIAEASADTGISKYIITRIVNGKEVKDKYKLNGCVFLYKSEYLKQGI